MLEAFLLLKGWSLIFGWLLGPVWPNLSFHVPHRIIVFLLSHIIFAAGLEDRMPGFWPSWSRLSVPTFLTCKPRVCWASYKVAWRNHMSMRSGVVVHAQGQAEKEWVWMWMDFTSWKAACRIFLSTLLSPVILQLQPTFLCSEFLKTQPTAEPPLSTQLWNRPMLFVFST